MKEALLTLRRALVVASAFWTVMWKLTLLKIHKQNAKQTAKAIRKIVERLGSIYTKFAQLVALRPDVVPKAFCQEMMYLLDDAPKVPFDGVKKLFEEEFNQSIASVFKEFASDPLASASIGQVHKAVLSTGEDVVVKIQRPGLDRVLSRDFKILEFLAGVFDIFTFWTVQLKAMVEEMHHWRNQELDFHNEAASIQKYRAGIKGDTKAIQAPLVYPHLTSKRVFTMEFVEGFTVSNYLTAQREGDNLFIQHAHEAGYEPKKIAIELFRESTKYTYLKGIYHADLHPGNVMFNTRTKQLFYIDFGILGEVTGQQKLWCMRYIRSGLFFDLSDSFESLLKMLDASLIKNIRKLRDDHDRIMLKMFAIVLLKEDTDEAPQILGIWMAQTIALLRKYKIKIPLYLLKYFRGLSVFESTVFEIDPDINVQEMRRKMRNLSLTNVMNNLSNMMQNESMDALLLKGLNAVEDYILTKGNDDLMSRAKTLFNIKENTTIASEVSEEPKKGAVSMSLENTKI